MLRSLVEFVPALQGQPLVKMLLGWLDPQLASVVQGAGLPWSREGRRLVLPIVAVAVFVLHAMIDDQIDRVLHRLRRRQATKVAAVEPAPAAPARPAREPAEGAKPAPAAAAAAQADEATALMPAPAPRKARIGRYEILGELGRGAMGVVYKAVDPKLGRTVAVKTISAPGAEADLEHYRARFVIEAKSAGRLNHPGVVAVYDVAEDDQRRPCIVLEYIEGVTLDKLAAADGSLPLQQTLDIIGQVARALAYAHANGIVHRDVKPANIMVTASGQAKLSDFGIAKLEGTDMTMAGQVLGTPAYMSPEQCAGSRVDQRSDIFSLGSVLYKMCTGERRRPSDPFTTVAGKGLDAKASSARQIDAELAAQLDPILARCLAQNPAERYASAESIADDLDALRAKLARTGGATANGAQARSQG